MRLPRLAPRLAISLPLSGLFFAARSGGAELAAAACAAGLIAAMLAPFAHWGAILASALAAGAAAALWAAGPGGAGAVLAALPLAGNLALAWHFGGTLRPGQEPLIARYSRAEHGSLPIRLAAYVRWLTLFWTAFFLLFAALGAMALAGAGPRPDTLAAWNIGLSVACFLGEHPLRTALFPALGPFGPMRTLRAIWRTDMAPHAR